MLPKLTQRQEKSFTFLALFTTGEINVQCLWEWTQFEYLNIWGDKRDIARLQPGVQPGFMTRRAWELGRTLINTDISLTSHLSRCEADKKHRDPHSCVVLIMCPRHANWCRKQKRILKTILINVRPGPKGHNDCFVDWQFVLQTPKLRKLPPTRNW